MSLYSLVQYSRSSEQRTVSGGTVTTQVCALTRCNLCGERTCLVGGSGEEVVVGVETFVTVTPPIVADWYLFQRGHRTVQGPPPEPVEEVSPSKRWLEGEELVREVLGRTW